MVSLGKWGFDLLKVEEKGLSLILGLNKGGSGYENERLEGF